MSSINTLCALSVSFKIPWLLFLLIPAFALMLWPYFRLPKQHRRTTSRVVSLVLHSVILLMCVFMLCGMNFEYTSVSIKNDVILLVDVSDSNKASEDDMNSFIREIVAESEEGYRLGIVTFANGQVYAAELNGNGGQAYENYIEKSKADKPEGNASDISTALLFARDKLADPSSGRIIVLSDGLQTDGNALAAVKTVADGGTRVDTVCFSPKGYKSEVQINSLEVPQRISVGETAQITVELQSSSAGTATVTLYDNGEYYDRQEVVLGGGTEHCQFNYTLITPKFHEFRAEVTAENDTLSQNNVYYSYLNIESSNRVLLVDGTGSETAQLEGILSGEYDLTKITLDGLPKTLEELCRYDEVVFANVANADLPAGFDDILTEYVEIYGGGFYTIGGDKAYQQEDMEGTKYQELLPVMANTEARSLGLLLVIDVSTSMKEIPSGSSSQRIDLAKEAAIASVEALGSDDYVGVVTFNREATRLVEMSPISRKDSIIRQIRDGIKISEQGTHYTNALKAAEGMLLSFHDTEMEHIIFLTDGVPVGDSEANFMNEVDRIARAGITLSTIALGSDVSTDTAEEMAERGGGRFYNVSRETELERIMVEETTVAASQYKNEIKATPTISSITAAAVVGITELPELGGFYGTRLKDGAIKVLDFNNNPIYAEWQRGTGRVGSFMSDLSGKWSDKFLADDSGKKFIINSIGSLLPTETNQTYADIRAEISNVNFSSEIRVYSDAANGETVTAQLVSPDGHTTQINLEKQTGNLYAGVFDTREVGVYEIKITKSGGGETTETSVYTVLSYSAEYSAFADDTECFRFLESVAENGNGSVLFSAENLFGRQNEVVRSTFNPQLTFLIISIVLFLLDIVVRKFKIKWPHEIIRERRNKDQEKAAQ